MDAILATIVAGWQARFWQHTIHRGKYKLINLYFNLLNLLDRFDGGIGKNMRTAAHPLGGVGLSNPRHWRGERIHHHGYGVC